MIVAKHTKYFHKVLAHLENLDDKKMPAIAAVKEKIKAALKTTYQAGFLKYVISHLSAINHYRKLHEGKSISKEDKGSDLAKLIKEGYKIISKEEQDDSKETKQGLKEPNWQASIVKRKDDYVQELERVEEQKRIDNDENFKALLHQVWKFAIENKHASKSVFVSYAWPQEDDHKEKWTKTFVEKLVSHLVSAGLKVYLDEFNSNIGNELSRFMEKIAEVDHVLLISSRTMQHKLGIKTSGVNCELKQILSRLQKEPDLERKKFIMPVLLNNSNYCHKRFLNLAEISFCKEPYLIAMQKLLCQIYQFGKIAFVPWWEKKLIFHKIQRNLWNAPPKNLNFVGRNIPLQQIEKSFYVNQIKTINSVTCSGLGGVGKTSLALEFMHKNYYRHPEIFWFNAGSKQLLIASYVQLGKARRFFGAKQIETSEEDCALIVKDWLSNKAPKNALVIYDDAPNPDEIKGLLPINLKMLITSRHTEWPTDVHIKLGIFNLEEAQSYVRKIISQEKFNEEKEHVGTLIKLQGYLPLALAQACAYIKRNQVSVKDYLQLYQSLQPEMLKDKLLPAGDQHAPVFFTWNVTLTKMKEESIDSLGLLYFCSYIHHQNISEGLLLHFFKEETQVLSAFKLNSARRIAREYSMIDFDGNTKCISLHMVLHEIIRIKVKEQLGDNGFKLFLERVMSTLISYFEAAPSDERRTQLSHLNIFVMHLENEIKGNSLNVTATANIFMLLARALAKQDDCQDKAESLYKKALGFLKNTTKKTEENQALMPSDIDLLRFEIIKNYSRFQRLNGKTSLCITMCFDTYQELKKFENTKEVQYLRSHLLSNFRLAYGVLYFFDPIEKLYEEKFQGEEKFPEGNSLGMSYYRRGNLIAAEKTFLVAQQQSYRHIIGTSLGGVYHSLGDDTKAKEEINKAFDYLKQKKKKDDNSPSMIPRLNDLGVITLFSGDYGKAKQLFEQAYRIHASAYGEKYYRIATMLNNLGVVYYALGEFEKSLGHFTKALDLNKKNKREDLKTQLYTIINYNNLAVLKFAMDTKKQYEQKSDGICYPTMMIQLHSLIFSYRIHNFKPNLKPLTNLKNIDTGFKEVKEMIEKLIPAAKIAHPAIAIIEFNLGLQHLLDGNTKDASDCLQRAYDGFKQHPSFGENHPNTKIIDMVLKQNQLNPEKSKLMNYS